MMLNIVLGAIALFWFVMFWWVMGKWKQTIDEWGKYLDDEFEEYANRR